MNMKFKAKRSDNVLSPQKPHQHQGQEESYLFLKTFISDYKRMTLMYNSCIQAEQERERRNKEEIMYLNKICNQMQNELISIKRKNWCRYCESEATYVSSNGNKFYCSRECEQKQMEFVGVINNVFKND